MGRTTTYKVELVYNLKGDALKGLGTMRQQAQRAQSSFGGLRTMMGLAFTGGAIAAGKKLFYDYNNQIEQMKIGMGTIISMNMGRPFKEGALAADKMFQNFQKMAIQSPATTKDFVVMANQISSSVLSSGKGLKDLELITQGAITAASALGAMDNEAQRGMFARDVAQMTRGQIRSVDIYARQLLRGVGYSDYNKFNKDVRSGKVNAADVTQKALTTPQIKDAAKAFEGSTKGVMSTFQDLLEITLAKVGLPLMKAMKEEVQKWNKWMQANPEKIAEFVSTLGNGLKEAFGVLKEIVVAIYPLIKDAFGLVGGVLKFASEHREMLIGLIKGMLVYKGVMMGVGAAGAIGGFARNSAGSFGTLIKGFSGGLTSAGGAAMTLGPRLLAMGGAIPGVLGGLAALTGAAYFAGKVLFGETNSEKKNRLKNEAAVLSAKEYTGKLGEYQGLLKEQKKLGIDPNDMSAGYGINQKVAEMKAQLEKTEEELVRQGLTWKGGAKLSESVAPGVSRTLTFNRGRGVSGHASDIDANMGTSNQLDAALEAMMAHKVEENLIKSGYYEAKAKRDALQAAGGMNDPLRGGWTEEYKSLNNEVGRAADQARHVADTWGTVNGVTMGGGRWQQSLVGDKMETLQDLYGMPPLPTAPKVDVTINKIEVASEDPDRFVHGMVGSFAEIVRNPTQAQDAIRGGF